MTEKLLVRQKAERSLLGSLLIVGSMTPRIAEIVQAEDFVDPSHALIFDTILQLSLKGRGIDLITVSNELERFGKLESAGGPAYLAGLLDEVPDIDNAHHYAHQVRDAAFRRSVAAMGKNAARMAAEAPDAAEVVDGVQTGFLELSEKSRKGSLAPIAKVANTAVEEMARWKSGGLVGISTGFSDVDSLLNGLQKGNLVVVAGRPGMGKTAFALNVASHLAVHERKRVAFFSLEMTSVELALRLFCEESGVALQRLRSSSATPLERAALLASVRVLQSSGLFIDDSAAASLFDIRSRAIRIQKLHGLDALFVDYLQIMGTRGRVENRTQEVSAFSRGLKALAKELEVPIVALSQLSRRTEQRGGEDKEPELSDLRESGAIEQDADVVIFLNRESYYSREASHPNACEVIVKKNRSGPVGRATVGWLSNLTRFASLSRTEMR